MKLASKVFFNKQLIWMSLAILGTVIGALLANLGLTYYLSNAGFIVSDFYMGVTEGPNLTWYSKAIGANVLGLSSLFPFIAVAVISTYSAQHTRVFLGAGMERRSIFCIMQLLIMSLTALFTVIVALLFSGTSALGLANYDGYGVTTVVYTAIWLVVIQEVTLLAIAIFLRFSAGMALAIVFAPPLLFGAFVGYTGFFEIPRVIEFLNNPYGLISLCAAGFVAVVALNWAIITRLPMRR